ncbi:MAG TPA: hypothetical protein PLX20_04860 [Rhodocyclaceae bacterium]|nr:hypothetical protein [Rhodocyclaceae bacterium]HMV52597.1 hypothetical protein [Rhodocyclaceae bacterium]HMZ84264.1 hypothetical protein [Rhodocyclaceae bacterium]HNA05244.1 hypothetical protein [Rhodocyclaceae bacterium]HNB79991.1 hypothetical protein [Rhodocyclaceae bacterium]
MTTATADILIPHRAETLQVLRLMGNLHPMLMLAGDDDGYGTRWVILGQQVQPAIASYLMRAGFIAESGTTEFGARILALTAVGKQFLDCGLRWWAGLSLLDRIKARVFG